MLTTYLPPLAFELWHAIDASQADFRPIRIRQPRPRRLAGLLERDPVSTPHPAFLNPPR
jgi:hypothetical protein